MDKIGYRYPRGESYYDILARLDPLVHYVMHYVLHRAMHYVMHHVMLRHSRSGLDPLVHKMESYT